MSYNASDAEAKALGFTLPKGTDLIKGGDNAITTNAKTAAGGIRAAINRLRTLENLPPGDALAWTAQAETRRALTPFRSAITGGTARIVWMGDSDTEGAGVSSRAQRTLDLVTADARAYWPGGDAGTGYTPVKYWTPWGFSDADPTWAGSITAIGYGGGLGNRSAQLDAAGASITFKPMSVRHLTLHFTARVAPYSGTVRVLADGTEVATVDTTAATADAETSTVWRHDFGTVKARTIRLEHATGTPRLEGITTQTALTGITSWDAGRSGGKVSDLASGVAAAPGSQEFVWDAVAAIDPHLLIAAFGRNDQASWSAAQWGAHLATFADRLQDAAPGAGLLLVVSPPRVSDRADDPARWLDFMRAAHGAIGNRPHVTITTEAILWTPDPAFPYETENDPAEWLAPGDTVHKGPHGHRLLADHLLGLLTADQPQRGPQGDPGPPGTHAAVNDVLDALDVDLANYPTKAEAAETYLAKADFPAIFTGEATIEVVNDFRATIDYAFPPGTFDPSAPAPIVFVQSGTQHYFVNSAAPTASSVSITARRRDDTVRTYTFTVFVLAIQSGA